MNRQPSGESPKYEKPPRELSDEDRVILGMLHAKFGENAVLTSKDGSRSDDFEAFLGHCDEMAEVDGMAIVAFIGAALKNGATITNPEPTT